MSSLPPTHLFRKGRPRQERRGLLPAQPLGNHFGHHLARRDLEALGDAHHGDVGGEEGGDGLEEGPAGLDGDGMDSVLGAWGGYE